jgi:hypothetical protein
MKTRRKNLKNNEKFFTGNLCNFKFFLLKPLKAVVFKLCAAALWGAVRNLRGTANFFRNKEYSSLSIEIWLIFQLNATQCSL